MLKKVEIQKVVEFIRQEPRTMQEISRFIQKSWVTADSYMQRIKEDTGLINIKTFRKGTQGALKIVYYSQTDASSGEGLKDELFSQIRNSRRKTDFDFFEIFQHVNDKKKRILVEEYDDEFISSKQKLVPLLRSAQDSVHIFSGNLSFINLKEGKTKIKNVIEELVKKKVIVKIICRVNVSSMNNISKLSEILKKYPEFIEIRHSFQPLRGFIIDEKVARFKSEEILKEYKPGELNKNMRIFYEIYDEEWIAWLQKVFWNMYRFSINYGDREKQLNKYF